MNHHSHDIFAIAFLSSTVKVPGFVDSIYQWANTLTQSGANYPFVLPLMVDKLPNGFQISLLKSMPKPVGGFSSAGDIQATIEEVEQNKQVLFIRFYEGPASMADRSVRLTDIFFSQSLSCV